MKKNPEDHLKLVHKITNRYSKGNRMEYDDIFQEGCIGLLRAIDEYKEGNVPFGTFAGMHIQFAILTALRKSGIFRINPETIWLASKIRKQELIDSPPVEIAEQLKTEVRFVERALEYLRIDVMSLDLEYGKKDGEPMTLAQNLPCNVNFDDNVYIEQMLDVFEVAERDKPILRMVLDGYTTKEAATMLGTSYKAAQQRKSLRKYRVVDKKHLAYS